jgi:hypothetical protein
VGYRSTVVGGMHLAWWNNPELGDADRLLDELRKVRAANGSVRFVTIIPRDSEPPPDKVRREFTSRLEQLFEIIEHAYAVIEGEGISSTLNRAIVKAMATVSSHRKRMSIHATMDEVLDHAKYTDRAGVRNAVSRLRGK